MEGETPAAGESDRRDFLETWSTLAMAGGLAASYGTLAAMAGRFLYADNAAPKGWMFVCELARLPAGGSFEYTTPDGQRVVVARRGEGEAAEDFVALSSRCPHLGCQVHWQAHLTQFFCPCHNGTFDAAGQPTGGPPLADNTPLPQYPLRVRSGLLEILVPLAGVLDGERGGRA